MKKKRIMRVGGVSIALLVAALLLVTIAPLNGEAAGREAMKMNGGVMDTAQYKGIMASAQWSVERLGYLLGILGIGGLFISVSKWLDLE